MKRFSLSSTLVVILTTALLSIPGAGRYTGLPSLISIVQADISLAQAVDLVKQKSEGRILSSRKLNAAGGKIYLIKVLLPSGQVTTYRVSAVDGSIQ